MDYTMIIMLVVFLAVFYFLLIRPEKKRKKQLQEMRDNLSVGNDITTIGGMVGTIVALNDKFVTFETGEDRVRIEVTRWAISTVGKKAEEQK